jgi:hypothetical protein
MIAGRSARVAVSAETGEARPTDDLTTDDPAATSARVKIGGIAGTDLAASAATAAGMIDVGGGTATGATITGPSVVPSLRQCFRAGAQMSFLIPEGSTGWPSKFDPAARRIRFLTWPFWFWKSRSATSSP